MNTISSNTIFSSIVVIIIGLFLIKLFIVIMKDIIRISFLIVGGAIGWFIGEGEASGVILGVIGGCIAIVLFIPSEQAKNEKKAKELERKQKEEQLEAERKLKQEQLEAQRKWKQDDDKYDRIINCPPCEGRGKAYIKTTWLGYYDDDGGYCSSNLGDKLASKMLFDMHPNEEWENDDWSYICQHKECPFCRGNGIAHAWYENIPTFKTKCEQCQGSGQITATVKLEIGMGNQKITCDKCEGIGSVQVPEKSVVHVKTISGGTNEKLEEGECGEGDSIGGYEKRFIMEITKENKELLEKSKPRS